MQRTLNMLAKVLSCSSCGGRFGFDSEMQRISCCHCSESFTIINSVPCFVAEELASFSEVLPEERETFLEMKRVAYREDSLISGMYNHYHRYAAQKRRALGGGLLAVDLGFGIGEHYPFISGEEITAGSFIGIDLDRFKLEYFTAIHPEIPVLQASVFRLPFAAGSVDVVQVLATLEHFLPGDITGVLDESLRILKPGGTLIACYPAEGGLLLRYCATVMHTYLKARTGYDLNQGGAHRHLTGAGEIRALLGRRDELERLESVFYPFGFQSINFSLFVNELYRKR